MLVLKESNKSRFDSFSRYEPCIDHIPYYLSGLSRATTFLETAVYNKCACNKRLHIYNILHTAILHYTQLIADTISFSGYFSIKNIPIKFLIAYPHMLVNCTEINSFWAKIISWWNHQSGDCYLVDELSILYDYYPEDKRTLIFNYFILMGKRHIFAQRIRTEDP